MEKHKRIGLITMVLSVVLAVATIVFSHNFCSPFEAPASIWQSLSVCMRLVVYQASPHWENPNDILIPTTYLMFFCLVFFAVGLLWFCGALPLSTQAKNKVHKQTP